MAMTSPPVNSGDRTVPGTGSSLLRASGLRLPSPPVEKSVPVVAQPATEKVTLSSTPVKLNDAEMAEISSLKERDRHAREHVQAHFSAAAGLNVSNADFVYQRGPNGTNYAVSGEVMIDTSPGRTHAETLARAEHIHDVALAPSDPSAVDRSVAAKAQKMAMEARAALQQEEQKAHGAKQVDKQVIDQTYENAKAPAAKIINTEV